MTGPLWWTGWLRLELRHGNIPAVLHALHQQGIPLYDVHPHGHRCTITIRLSDFRTVHRTCRRHRVRFRILSKAGWPFALRRLRRRPSMLAGAAVFICLLYGLSSVIWDVTVSGAKDADVAATVLQAARELGVAPGAWKSRVVDLAGLQTALLTRVPDAAWVGVTVEGTRVNIQVLEKVPGTAAPATTPVDVVASKPGVIRRVLATRGQALVRPGQTVQPGQVLISGQLAGGVRQVAAAGQVMAEVWYTSRVEVPLTPTRDALTGRFVAEDYLNLGSLQLRVWGWREPGFSQVLERDTESDWHIGTWKLPIQWRHVELYEATTEQLQRSRDEALREALTLAAQDVRARMHDGQVLGQKVLQQQVERGKLYATVLTWTEEDIGQTRPVANDTPSPSHS